MAFRQYSPAYIRRPIVIPTFCQNDTARGHTGSLGRACESRSDDDERKLTLAVFDTIGEPLLVLDKDLQVIRANRSFHLTFNMNRQEVQGRPIDLLGFGQWNIPSLLSLLKKTATQHATMQAFEVEQDVAGIGRRTMLLKARRVFCPGNPNATILLAFEDVTERRAKERELN